MCHNVGTKLLFAGFFFILRGRCPKALWLKPSGIEVKSKESAGKMLGLKTWLGHLCTM